MGERKALFEISVGTPGCGKSTLMTKMLDINSRNLIFPSNTMDDTWKKYPSKKPVFEWVVDPNDFKGNRQIKKWRIPGLNTFKGNLVVDMSGVREQKDQEDILTSIASTEMPYMNGGIFIDDCKNFIPSKGTLKLDVSRMFRERRHRMIDIFLAVHGFEDINADMIKMGAAFWVFRTDLPPTDAVRRKFGENIVHLEETRKRVNDIAKSSNPYYCVRYENP